MEKDGLVRKGKTPERQDKKQLEKEGRVKEANDLSKDLVIDAANKTSNKFSK